jgi:hypothetical protein
MKIELKNVKISKQFSEETILFSADVSVNGRIVAYANNDGRGGCTFYNAYPETRDLLVEAENYLKTLPSKKFEYFGKEYEIESNMENWIDDEINKIFNEKEIGVFNKKLKKQCETKICWGVKGGNSYKTIGFNGGLKLADMLKTKTGKQVVEKLVNRIKGELTEGEEILNENIDFI